MASYERIPLQPTVYIMASQQNGTIYTGVTAAPAKRICEHKLGLIGGFTRDYGCKLLVFFELHETMKNAISREKRIKGWLRKKKVELIESINPMWLDLYDDMLKLGPARLLTLISVARYDGSGWFSRMQSQRVKGV